MVNGGLVLNGNLYHNNRNISTTWYPGLNNTTVCEGNVGIGTQTSGNYKLAVEGSIGCREIFVTQDNWADFVFEKDYRVPSIDSIAKFIDTHKHLPGIPTEQEVKTNGLNVGEMQKILLQKIEELTLVIIQQQKAIDELQTVTNTK